MKENLSRQRFDSLDELSVAVERCLSAFMDILHTVSRIVQSVRYALRAAKNITSEHDKMVNLFPT
jgi:hypothetical protein